MSTAFYNKNANSLVKQYLSKTFTEVHQSWIEYLQPILARKNARILDLGAGAGRDSKQMAEWGRAKNIQVMAVEPAQALANLGEKQTQCLNVQWVQDALPNLEIVTRQEVSFDLILLSAVWMHIPQSDRQRSIRKLANLLKPGGKLVISLRHGPSGDERNMFDVCSDQLLYLAKEFGFTPLLVTNLQKDRLDRAEVSWQTVVLQHEMGSKVV